MIIRGSTRSIYFYAVLISLSLVVVSLSKPGIAESLNSTKAAPRTYNISAGYLHDALIQFSQQAGIKLAIDSAMLQGKVTLGLTGDFEIKPALDQLLTGSGLQVVQQGDGYILSEVLASPADPVITTLPSIQITASNTNRYAAVSTSTATKTNTLLRDVPQSITVITNDLIKDQSIRSIGDAVRYVPGVGVSQGEGNRDALVMASVMMLNTTAIFIILSVLKC